MADTGAINIIRSIQKKWLLNSVLSYFIMSFAITILLVTFLIKFLDLSWWWGLPVLLVSFAVIFFIYNSWKVTEADVTKFLNQQFPQLEESSGLLLKPYDSLNMLEKLQVKKVEQTVTQLPAPISFNKKLKQPGLMLLAVLLISALVYFIPFQKNSLQSPGKLTGKTNNIAPEKILPDISSIQVTIKPPAYTGRPLRNQSLFNIKAEEGADIGWQVKTTVPVDTLQLVMNGSTIVPLRSNEDHTQWSIGKNFKTSGFYQVKIDNKLSELYKIEITKDVPPVIAIQKPKSYTIIDYGQPQQVGMYVLMEDDYGIKEASISATTTTGSGEGVKFKEQKLSFNSFAAGDRKYNLQKLLDLPSLGMKPGDELYFYVRCVDNFNQESRSDVYMISLPDTAQLMSLEGLASGVDIKPEFFRSERQIIIETEQLLKDQKTLAAEDFKNKSNDLGIDQKLLRIRYGKFLGDESDGPGKSHHDDHEQSGSSVAADFNNADKIMDEVAHKHDNAEDATFFDSQTKKQLKSILDEMWNAEVRLRTLKPLDALPYEYKALRLLKDLQEKGRSYVAKTSYKTTPLKPEKRLSGDLTKIEDPTIKTDFKKKDDPEEDVRRSIGIIENLKAGTVLDKSSLEILKQAGLQLNKKASAEPSVYLLSVGAMNRILMASENSGVASATDLTTAQKGLQKLTSLPEALPGPDKKDPDQNLSQQYFKNLKQQGR